MKGIVVCVDPRAAEEGAKVLEFGGNAFDAAITTAFVQMIVTPFSCGIGGMISAHLWDSSTEEHQIIDGCLRAGSLVTEDMWVEDYIGESEISGESLFSDFRSSIGYTSICTPGTVSGLWEIHKRYCSMPWKDLLQPAIRFAREGYAITPDMNRSLQIETTDHRPGALARISATPECARIYLQVDGSVPREGNIVKNYDYASTLNQLARYGGEDFYCGELADTIVDDFKENGSFITRDDLREYRVNSYHPKCSVYGGYEVFSNAPPGGGAILQEALNVLDGLNLRNLSHNGLEYLSYLGSTLQLVNQDRKDYQGDPEVIGKQPGEFILSKKRAIQLQHAVRSGIVGGELTQKDGQDTTHLNVVDKNGNVASITHSLGQHSGVVTPGLGFIYNNGMARFDPRPGHASSLVPRKARIHLMMPTIVFKDAHPAIVLGAPGGNSILSGLVQVLINVVDFDMKAVEAVTVPRIHAEGNTIWCEARTRVDICEALRERGYNVIQDPASLSGQIARVQLVIIRPDGSLDGGSDLRGPSGVMVVS